MRLAALGLGLALQACVVHEAAPVNPGYGYPYGYGYGLGYGTGPGYEGVATVGEPTPYEVSTQAPEPLDDQMTQSPGDGYDWIDGYWHWNGYDWVWVSGRWEHEQDGYVYVQPYYDYSGASYVYTPGYWAPRNRVPIGWTVRGPGNGHPATLVPPAAWHNPARPIRPIGPVSGGVHPTNTNNGYGNGLNRPQSPTSVGGYQQLPQRSQPIINTPAHNEPGPIEGGRSEPEQPILYDRPTSDRPAGAPTSRPVETQQHPAAPTHSSGSHPTSSGGHRK
jgi:WXXGXW repeat (2 copies)